MRMQDVYDILEARGWFRIEERIRLENLSVSDYRIYAHRGKPGVVITLVGTPDSYVGPGALANIYARAGIEQSAVRQDAW